MKVCVIGLGYIGLPTAAVVARAGFQVIGIDVSEHVVSTINRGQVHIVEPELDKLVEQMVQSGRLTASTQMSEADVYLIAVPTPLTEGKVPDVSYIESAVNALAPCLQSGNLVVLESTSPIGTTQQVGRWIATQRPDLCDEGGQLRNIHIAHCPERVLPGNVLHELVMNDRVIGGNTTEGAEKAVEFYQRFVKGTCTTTDCRTAEMVKLTENSFRDVNIAFANELSLICDQHDIDVWELISLANRHPRVNILNPGPGVGGHCIAVDPWFLVDAAPELANMIRTARQTNDYKPHWVVEKIRKVMTESNCQTIRLYGLSFKADIDDLRESPAIEIAEEVLRLGVAVEIVEPYIDRLPESLSGAALITLSDQDDFSGLSVLLVDHSQFKEIRFDDFQGPFIDTRGIWRAD